MAHSKSKVSSKPRKADPIGYFSYSPNPYSHAHLDLYPPPLDFPSTSTSLPASIGMTALALGISRLPPTLPDIALAILTGLNAAAVGLIALAAYQLSLSVVTDKVTRGLVLVTASAGICYHAPWVSRLVVE